MLANAVQTYFPPVMSHLQSAQVEPGKTFKVRKTVWYESTVTRDEADAEHSRVVPGAEVVSILHFQAPTWAHSYLPLAHNSRFLSQKFNS